MTVGTTGTSDRHVEIQLVVLIFQQQELVQQQEFFRISVLAGTVNIGSTTGNTIGSTTENVLFRFHLPLP
jgi:translation initiation factor 6 (eIF-6)